MPFFFWALGEALGWPGDVWVAWLGGGGGGHFEVVNECVDELEELCGFKWLEGHPRSDFRSFVWRTILERSEPVDCSSFELSVPT